jgi:uncharacterized membrane protein
MNKLYLKLNKKIYFIPAIYSIISFIIALLVISIDKSLGASVSKIPSIFLTEIDLGRSIFSTMIGAILTMITVTFSTMLVVLTLYSSEMSPRSMQDFLEQKFISHILGLMTAVFVFSIVSLFAMKEYEPNRLVISPFFGVVLSIVTIVSFIYFIHKVSQHMRVNIYIQKLTEENIGLINEKYLVNIKDNGITNVVPDNFEDVLIDEPIQIKSTKSGFIQLYDEKKLWGYALDKKLLIVCENAIGEFVLEDNVLFSIHIEDKEKLDVKEINKKLNEFIVIGDDSNKNADIEAGLRKLAEIGVKALSPGINDPNTAYYCIENLGFLLSKMGMQFDRQFFLDNEGSAVLVVENTPFVELLYKSFYQLRLYGKDDYFIIGAILNALARIAEANNYQVKVRVWQFAKYILEDMTSETMKSLDVSYLNRKVIMLANQTNQSPKELVL